MIKIMKHEFNKTIVVDITTVVELKSLLDGLEEIGAKVVMQHRASNGLIFFTDMTELYLDMSPTTFPETLEEWADELTDQQYDGYRIANPMKNYGRIVMTSRISDLRNLTASAVNINQPSNRHPIIVGEERYPDLVIEVNEDSEMSTDMSNWLFCKDGRVQKSIVLNNEMFVPGGIPGLHENNNFLIDFDWVGGIDIYGFDICERIVKENFILVRFDETVTFDRPIFIILDGVLYDLPHEYMKVVDQHTIKIYTGFSHIDTPGYRKEFPNISDEEWPNYRIKMLLDLENSFVVRLKEKVFITKHTLVPCDPNTYAIRNDQKHISGIVFGAHQRYLLPYKILPSKPHLVDERHQHLVKIMGEPKPKAIDELQLFPVGMRDLNKPYRYGRNDIEFLGIGI